LKKLLVLILAALALAAVYFYFIRPSETAPAEESAVPAVHVVTIENYAFSPAEIAVKAGDKVVWENKDSTNHSVTSDTELFDSGLFGEGQEFEEVFSSAGVFPYHCVPHPQMVGTVVVSE
jgi:plastocyanin